MHTREKAKATALGFLAVLMWATLPLLTKLAGDIPPFELTAAAFSLSFALTVLVWKRQGKPLGAQLRLRPKIWLLGAFGLFGFHFCYFMAFRYGPAVEVYLIDNLWPLMIVIFSLALFREERARWYHITGVTMGFLGVTLITLQGGELNIRAEYLASYGFALACALIWSVYSVLSRKWAAEIPAHAVGAFCGISALLSWLSHLAFETWTPLSLMQSFLVLLMGLGPIGAAFFLWDYGVKRGDITVLGSLTYIGTLLGLALLILFGFSEFSWRLAFAAALIIGGAFTGSLGMLRRTPPVTA